MSERPRAGWYPDPAGSPLLRYWDGAQWTESVQSHPGSVVTDPRPAPTPAATSTTVAGSDVVHPALGTRPHGPSPDGGARRKRLIVAGAIAAVVVAVVAVVVATTGGDDSPDGDAVPTASAPTTAATSAATEELEATTTAATAATGATGATTTVAPTTPAPKGPPFPEGALQVGVDIPAGRYEAAGGTDCYWERMRGSDGSERITNRLGGGHVIVDIADTDTVFRSEKCGTWSPAGPFLVPQPEFDDGIWAINTQIVPGRYRNTGGAKCYWARLKSFGGEGADIVANAQPTRAVTVEILASDVGFESRDCGHWTKV